MTMIKDDDALTDHLRRTLRTVADTVTEADLGVGRPLAASPRRRVPVLVAALVAVAALGGVVAWNHFNPAAVVRIPTESALMSGTAEGGRWWIIPSAIIHPRMYPGCRPPAGAVEIVSDASNRPGQEWNTGGVVYGEWSGLPDTCPREADWLANPLRFSMGSTRLGPSNDGGDPSTAWGYFLTVHPSIDRVRVTVDGGSSFTVDTVALPRRLDGPRFAGFTAVPDSKLVVVDLLAVDGHIVWSAVSRPAG